MEKVTFLNIWVSRSLLEYFGTFQTSNRIKTADFSRIRPRIDGIEGEHADHMTTTAAQGEGDIASVIFIF